VCTGNGRAPAPSGASLDLPDRPSADVPTLVLRLDHRFGEPRRDDGRPVVRMES